MRGKHAARATKRANEAAVAHIDRLTDKLTEAKIIARQNQTAARELPASREELQRLRKQLADGTSDALERERAARKEDQLGFESELRRVGRLFKTMMDRYELGLTPEEWSELRDVLGPLDQFFPSFGDTRTARRNSSRSAARQLGFRKAVAELENKTGYGADAPAFHPQPNPTKGIR